MHCPDGINGTEYVALVAFLSSMLSKDLSAEGTLILSELLHNVSDQPLIIAALKHEEEHPRKRPPPAEPPPGGPVQTP